MENMGETKTTGGNMEGGLRCFKHFCFFFFGGVIFVNLFFFIIELVVIDIHRYVEVAQNGRLQVVDDWTGGMWG